jgi:putative oxidoreductase
MAIPLAPKPQTSASSFGLLLLRLVVGIALCIHGWPKVQNLTTWMNGMPEPAAPWLQALAATSEFAGGIALAAGLLTPLAALGIACTMGYATWFHFDRGDPFVPGPSGGPAYELPLTFFAAALCIMLCGPGKASVDAVMFKRG